ncbi:SMa0974 family conjugal transfer regulator [Rhizobium redzepovicii]|uniref:SMa0974 family conjugal transfer regulator n=1 Tax=Rhizobium redzepovicii TaxID=2867518 RepID=UPI004047876D
MERHVAEAHITVPCIQDIAENMCVRIHAFCRSITSVGADRFIDFGNGYALLRAIDNRLLFRVCARDLVTFHGIRALLQGSLLLITPALKVGIEWFPADGSPPRAICERLKYPWETKT